MSAGSVLDYRAQAVHPSEWVEGRPDASWTGRIKNATRYEVTAFRCAACGLLKLYADAPATAPGNVYR